MSLDPGISVIIPVRNGGLFLAEAIESVLEQQVMVDFEILIIDDGSTDGTLDIARKYQNAYQFIRVINNKKRGVGSALQFGLQNSLSPLVVRLDADDRMLPGRLQSHLASFSGNPELVLQGSQIQFIGEFNPNLSPNSYPSNDSAICRFLEHGNAFADPSVAFRRDKAIAVGGFRNFLNGAEQYDLWMRLSLVGVLENLGQVYTQYRIHNKQFTKTRNYRVYISTILVQLFWLFGITQLQARFLLHRTSHEFYSARTRRVRIPFYISRYVVHILVDRIKK